MQAARKQMAGDAQQIHLRRWIPSLVSLAIFAAVLLVIHRELESFNWRDVLAHVRAIPDRALLAALACTAGSYLLLGGFDLSGLRYVGKPLAYWRVALSSFIAYAISHNLGAAALTGGAVRYRLYTAARLTGPEVATVQGFCSLTAGIGIAVLIGLSLLTAPQQAAQALHLLEPWSTIVGAVLLAVVAAYAGWGAFSSRGLEVRGWVLRPPGAALTLAQILLGAVELSVAAAVLWWLLPEQTHLAFRGFLAVYALAVAAGIVSHIPAGLGVFESVILVSLPGAAPDALIGSLLTYRIIYYLLPLLVAGLAFATREMREHSRRLSRVETLVAAYVEPIAPQVAGVLVFVAGIILLVSGAIPGVHARVVALGRVAPAPLLETSHLVGSICGLGLLVLARALFRRVYEAYRLAMVVLAAGAVASILKGLDFEEATILAIVMGVLWLGRRGFHRRASIVGERFTPAWVVGIVGVMGAVLWIGLFAHRHVQYAHEIWWTFAASADAPRSLRASLLAVLAAGTFLAWNLLRPTRPEPILPTAAELETARRITERSDATLANAVLAGDKRLLFAPHKDAFIMYQVARRSWVALGDPVGAREAHEGLVWKFRELADQHDAWTVFYQASAELAPLYLDVGLTPVKLGEEARVWLPEFSLSGAGRAELRQAHRRAQRDGALFEMVDPESLEPLLPDLRRISQAWLEEKATAEKGFSMGFFREEYIRRFPIALVRREGAPVAFANVWSTASRAELSIDLMRFGPDSPRGVMDFLFAELMLWGRAQGYRWFNLGMAPLAGLENHPLAPSWHRIGAFVFRHGENFYNFEGLRRYKSKFGPVWDPKYLAAPPGLFVLPRVLMDVSTLIAGGVKELVTK